MTDRLRDTGPGAALPWLQIHAATLLFGLAGLFGKAVDLPSIWIVFGRVLFASVTLWLVIRLTGARLTLHSRRDALVFIGLGLVLAVHWVTFFQAIKVSTVAVGLLAFSSFPIFTTFMEPLVFRERFRLVDLGLAVVTFTGIALVVPRFDLGDTTTQGVLWGLVSGFTFAVLSLASRKYVRSYSGVQVAFWQDSVALVVLVPFVLALPVEITVTDWALLAVLGVVLTALAHVLFIASMKAIRAQQASLVVSLEPVYGIAFAALLLSEIPSARVIAGGALILGAAFATSRLKG